MPDDKRSANPAAREPMTTLTAALVSEARRVAPLLAD